MFVFATRIVEVVCVIVRLFILSIARPTRVLLVSVGSKMHVPDVFVHFLLIAEAFLTKAQRTLL